MVGQAAVRRAAKAAAANVLHHSGIRRAVSAVRRWQSGGRRIVIVGYHRVVEDFTGEVQRCIPGTLISAETFGRQLEEAHRAGFEFASLGDAVEVMRGQRRARRDLMVVTFDDGYLDVYRNALPLLSRKGIPAVMYVPTAFVGTNRRFDHDRLFHLIQLARERHFRPLYDALPAPAAGLLAPLLAGTTSVSAALDDFIGEHPQSSLQETISALERQLGGGPELTPKSGAVMGWDELRDMAAQGFTVGAHTVNHTVLTLQSPADAEREILEGRNTLQEKLGRPVVDFAYCNGWYSEELVSILARHGFRSAVTTEDFVNRVGGDPYTLKRKVLWENFSVGALGDYSSAITSCHLDDTFGALGLHHPVPGKRPQASPAGAHPPA